MNRPVWVSVTSHRARGNLHMVVERREGGRAGPDFGIWPERGHPRGEYYCVAARHADALRKIKGLRVLRGRPTGGRVFRRFTF